MSVKSNPTDEQLVTGNELGDAIAVLFGFSDDQRCEICGVRINCQPGKLATVSFDMFVNNRQSDSLQEILCQYVLKKAAPLSLETTQ